MSVPSKGRPSLSQLRVGGGTPMDEHFSSSGLSTAMVISSGELELDIFGGSGYEEECFGSVVKPIYIMILTWNKKKVCDYQAQ